MSDLTPTRDMTKYREWIAAEFSPLTLATPDTTLDQQVENAIRYWNHHSAYKISAMVDYVQGQTRAQLPAAFKYVAEVYPNKKTTWLWNDHPLWTMTSVNVLDSVTTDLIMMSEAFRSYRKYVGTDFRHTFVRSGSMTEGGYLYAINVPGGTTALFVMGTRQILPDEDVTDTFILDWLLPYFKALVKQVEGNTLRKSSIINLSNDGNDLVREGKDEMAFLQKELERNSRWVAFVKRQ